ncbi:MAG: saccharopine dehydrogenase NADP-binding domain-containing protein [Saprospiraceae bacterium]|nr:saccharopine dehydrogenase NADP-binding domain-containing protein [Saprospiraceae bacterium]
MKKIFVVGAGLSSASLIDYLLKNSVNYDWEILIGDLDQELANQKLKNHPNGKAVYFDVFSEEMRNSVVSGSDIVISLLPADLHYLLLETCLRFSKNLITASYVPDELWKKNQEFIDKGMTVIYECGLDPGIDHMSAMEILDKIRMEGGNILSFKSSTGGLVATENDDNPWNYKFTWNPRNVVLAGKAGAQYKQNGKLKYVPYHRLFERAEPIKIEEDDNFETYPNRDSLKYLSVYGLHNIETMYRGTIRRSGFSNSWNQMIKLGLTEDSFVLENSKNMTYRELLESLLPEGKSADIREKVASYLNIEIDSTEMKKLEWLEIFQDKIIPIAGATPAIALQKLLEEKWKLNPDDKDMIVMQHEFVFETNQKDINKITSSLVLTGKDKTHTAMAMTVGLPLGIAAKLILTGQINKKGILIPIQREIYKPILEELQEFNITFKEKKEKIKKGNQSPLL